MPKVSVALATCNGAKFLAAQLESIAAQTLLPEELVVSDDASGDDTIEQLEHFSRRSPFPVHLLSTDMRQGVLKNFSRAIKACAGEIIALADQDDVWRADKLEKLVTATDAPATLAAFSDAEVVDERLVPLGYSMWTRVRFGALEQQRFLNGTAFSILLKHHVVTGATLAFKAHLRDRALPIPEDWPHDAWIALIAAAQGELVAIPEKLVAYRQHAGNVVGGRRRGLFAETRAALALDRDTWYRTEIGKWRELASRLGNSAPGALAEKIAHLEVRAGLPSERWRRLPSVMGEVFSGSYARYARNWGSVGIDLIVK
jgi:glycosyltransferase involved in cell wall biosynthesis